MNGLKKTPYYRYNTKNIVENYRRFTSAIPRAAVRYAVKSNSLKEVIKVLSEQGSGFEVASSSELSLLLTCGISPQGVFFSNPVKSPNHISYAFRKGVNVYSYDSSEELDKLAKYAPGCSVILRLRVYEKGSVFSLNSKFGAEEGEAVLLVKKALNLGLHFKGLSFHVGSQSLKLSAWKFAMEKVARVEQALSHQGIAVEAVDLGGGFPWQYRIHKAPSIGEIAQVINPYLDSLKAKEVYAEPGRFIVASSANLTASIILRTDRLKETWLYLDAGTYNALFEAMSFQGPIQYRVGAEGKVRGPMKKFILAGPTCDSIDTITTDAILPARLQAGDRLCFYDVGAYTNTLSTGFNGFKPPRVEFER